MDRYIIRRYRPGDEYAVADVVAETLRKSNSRDYSPEFIQKNIEDHSAENIAKSASGSQHMYVVCHGETVIGCGAIDGYWGSETESYIMTVFVLPQYQNKGIGRRIIKTLEQDEIFLRAHRTEVGSSVTAVGFYRKLGYTFKNGIETPDEFGAVRMEKRSKLQK